MNSNCLETSSVIHFPVSTRAWNFNS